MKKNLLPIIIALSAGYYFYAQSKKQKNLEKLTALDPSKIDELERIEAAEKKPKTLLAKAAALVKKAANTPEGKSLIKKGVKAITQKKQLKKMGADYLYS
jgi:hypothetical protein